MPLDLLKIRVLANLIQSPTTRLQGPSTRRAQQGAPPPAAGPGALTSPWTGRAIPRSIDDVESADPSALSRVREKRGW
jgi:hypothetical protein